jgi:hypothetical protein
MKYFPFLIALIALSMVEFTSCSDSGAPSDGPDTTSHRIYWKPDSLGGPPSVLLDVWGTSQTNVYAVGVLYGVGTGSGNFLIHYDGAQWSAIHDDSLSWWIAAGILAGIHGTSDTNIFVVGSRFNNNVTTGFVGRWNGRKWFNVSPDSSTSLLAVCVKNTSDVYVGGANGTILHHNGSGWTQLQTGTTLDVNQIIGLTSGEVFAVASEYYNSLAGSAVLRLSSTGATMEHFFPIGAMFGLWGMTRSRLYVAGEGIYLQTDAGSWTQLTTPFPAVTFFSLCGTNENNIVTAGAYVAVGHWSGRTWMFYPDLYDRSSFKTYFKGFAVGNWYFLVGETGIRALINVGFQSVP